VVKVKVTKEAAGSRQQAAGSRQQVERDKVAGIAHRAHMELDITEAEWGILTGGHHVLAGIHEKEESTNGDHLDHR
jgi:hypothetical protein